MKHLLYLLAFILLLANCNSDNHHSDAYGNFETTEILVSSEASGQILRLDIEEGQLLKAGQDVGLVDTIQLNLKKEQLVATRSALLSKAPDISSQIKVLQEQIDHLMIEKRRVENLIKAEAATTKQLDDINGQIDVLKRQIAAQTSTLSIQSKSLLKEAEPLKIQAEQLQDQIEKSKIINPIDGVVLAKYAEEGEITSYGRPLYRIGNLSEMTLRAYVSEGQLSQIKIGQQVKVLIDKGQDVASFPGKITWISSKSEFTPKTIQTKDERINLVYAFKVKVKNEGALKIGMPGEVIFSNQ